VGGSKKHGGADLGPTRAKRAWAALGVDGMGVADHAPAFDDDVSLTPKLTCAMVARLQGWRDEWNWEFSGRKTARYRQIGNAFPPPVAEAVGRALRRALTHAGTAMLGGSAGSGVELGGDPVLAALRSRPSSLSVAELGALTGLGAREVLRCLEHLGHDFELVTQASEAGPVYRLGAFKAFLGQADHSRHERFAAGRSTVS
jgi:DNA (cytosine-5)-methyltransferase 1